MPASVRSQLVAEMRRARAILARGGHGGREALARLAWLEAQPDLVDAVCAVADEPTEDRYSAVLALLSGPVDAPPFPAIDAADVAAVEWAPPADDGPPLVTARDLDPLPAPGTRADRPAIDPADTLRAAADRAIQRRRTSSAPLPMETLRVYYGELIEALGKHAPGAAFPDRHSAPDGWGDAHAAWREAHPMAAVALDRMLSADPHSADFAAWALDLVAVVRDGATVIDSDDF